MMDLERCNACDGFVPPGARACPNCGAASAPAAQRAGALGYVVRAAAALATAATLMACYGPPIMPDSGHPDGSADADTTDASDAAVTDAAVTDTGTTEQ